MQHYEKRNSSNRATFLLCTLLLKKCACFQKYHRAIITMFLSKRMRVGLRNRALFFCFAAAAAAAVAPPAESSNCSAEPPLPLPPEEEEGGARPILLAAPAAVAAPGLFCIHAGKFDMPLPAPRPPPLPPGGGGGIATLLPPPLAEAAIAAARSYRN